MVLLLQNKAVITSYFGEGGVHAARFMLVHVLGVSKIHHLVRYLQKEMEDMMKCDAKLWSKRKYTKQ